jgi:hypothetical protein
MGLICFAWITIGRELLDGGGLVIFFIVIVAMRSLINFLPMRKVYIHSLFLNSAGGEHHAFSTRSQEELDEVEVELRNAITCATGCVIQASEQ